jgi:SAM-dependent methyltransferase/uncharacterized protein YbaR (Trm112 family)
VKPLTERLRCPNCGLALDLTATQASCGAHVFPVEDGIPRLLPEDLMRVRQGSRAGDLRARTYRSFGFEWKSFAAQLPAYEVNFRWYLEPLGEAPLAQSVVLDAGCGMGRHTHHLLARGAEVVALDASPAIDVAYANNASERGLFVQADLLHIPLESDTCDLACCLGVLHHVEDPARGIRELVRVVRPGGWVLVYVYHDVSETSAARQRLLWFVTQARRVTTRMPLPLLRGATFGLAALLWVAYVLPCKMLSRLPSLRRRVTGLPLGQYVDYPFRVFWNDQFDRFSAPLERRYRREAVAALLEGAGLQEVRILGGYGWRAAGRKPGGDPAR